MLDLDWQARTIAVCSPTADRFRLLLPALYAATERNLSVVCLWPLNNEVGFLPLDRLFQIRKRGATSLTMPHFVNGSNRSPGYRAKSAGSSAPSRRSPIGVLCTCVGVSTRGGVSLHPWSMSRFCSPSRALAVNLCS